MKGYSSWSLSHWIRATVTVVALLVLAWGLASHLGAAPVGATSAAANDSLPNNYPEPNPGGKAATFSTQGSVNLTGEFFQAQGSNASDAAGQAIAWVGQTLQHQIDLLAYVDVFWTLAVIGAIMVPVALSLRAIDLKAPARGH